MARAIPSSVIGSATTCIASGMVALSLALAACSKPPPDPDAVPTPSRTGGGSGSGGASSGGGSGGSGGGGGTGNGGAAATGGTGVSNGGSPGGSGVSTGGGPGGSGASTGGSGATAGGAGGGTPGGTGGAGPAIDASAEAGTTPPVDPLPPGVEGHPSPAVAYPKYPGFTLAMAEEFDAPLDLDKDPIWTWSDGGLTEGQVRFVKDAISFRDGKMILTASRPGAPTSPSYAEPVPGRYPGEVTAKNLRSGEMRTKLNNYRYGRYEVRFKAPTSNGNFISTLFVFRTPKFEQWREIDIEVTADRPDRVFTNLINADGALGWSPQIEEPADRFPTGPGAMGIPAGFNNQREFHTYAFEWLPEQITWYVDGIPVRVKRPGGGRPIPQLSAKVVMNLWIFGGGEFGGDPTRNVYPLSAEYEWFRFYKWDKETTYPCKATPDCLPAEDRNLSKNNPSDGLPP